MAGAGCRSRFVFGYFAFRSRIKGVYFSIITQALTFAAMLLFFRNETGFGGNNGFTDFKRSMLGYSITERRARALVLFGLTAVMLAGEQPGTSAGAWLANQVRAGVDRNT
jgi:ABC-type branched-subunit amino acid transport system permease subunit